MRRAMSAGVFTVFTKLPTGRHPELVEGSDTHSESPRVREYYVYILTNSAGVLYVGVTSNLEGRFWEHVYERRPGFVTRYNLDRLIFYESYPSARDSITREKQIKGWRREKKTALIHSVNPSWRDLSGRLQ
jgi:putative endonuclease